MIIILGVTKDVKAENVECAKADRKTIEFMVETFMTKHKDDILADTCNKLSIIGLDYNYKDVLKVIDGKIEAKLIPKMKRPHNG